MTLDEQAQRTRTDLAAAFRLAAKLEMNEGIDNHFTARVPGTADRFFINPKNLHWAEIRASDVLYKGSAQADFIPAHTGDSYREVAHDLYTSDIALTTGARSGALTNPFSSVVGIVAEFGLIGTVAMLVLLFAAARLGFRTWGRVELPAAWRAAGAAAGFGVPLLLFLGIFDSYFEQPDVTAMLITLLLVSSAAPEAAGRDRAP